MNLGTWKRHRATTALFDESGIRLTGIKTSGRLHQTLHHTLALPLAALSQTRHLPTQHRRVWTAQGGGRRPCYGECNIRRMQDMLRRGGLASVHGCSASLPVCREPRLPPLRFIRDQAWADMRVKADLRSWYRRVAAQFLIFLFFPQSRGSGKRHETQPPRSCASCKSGTTDLPCYLSLAGFPP